MTVLTLAKYVPPVNEEVDEQTPPQYVRTIRQTPKQQIWNFQSIPQPDHLRTQYRGQQLADFRNIKFNQKQESEWKPFQPKYIPVKPTKRFSEKKTVKRVQDLHTANSETVEQTATVDKQDENTQYVYVQQHEAGPSGLQELQNILVDAPGNIQVSTSPIYYSK